MRRRQREEFLVATLQAIQRTSDRTADELRNWAKDGLRYTGYALEPEATMAQIEREMQPRIIRTSDWL